MDDCHITVNVNVLRDTDNTYDPPTIRIEDDGDGDVKLSLRDPDRDIVVSQGALMRALRAVGGD